MHAGDSGGVVGGSDTYLQSKEAFRRVKDLTEACGASLDDILILRVYLTDISEKGLVGTAKSETFSGDFPCSALVEVSRLVEDGLTVEIEALRDHWGCPPAQIAPTAAMRAEGGPSVGVGPRKSAVTSS
ncbi:RidA family protein [Arthrobacter sp. ISL-72]|uniref:RidA family protein n=1 Tax=Arthrobacter sp. ISL-72 TaxID=2819114 RepID=UPI001BE654BF|nr:RidA family protein [Arthrobacter sp. ISL-72]